jgi:hypothetical protein
MAWRESQRLIAGTTTLTGVSGVFGFIWRLNLRERFPGFDDLTWDTLAGEPPRRISSGTAPLEHGQDFTESMGDRSIDPAMSEPAELRRGESSSTTFSDRGGLNPM